jgi:aminoglycoside phosphotransferase (APT) family kinase protein
MKTSKAIGVASLLTSLLGAPLPELADDEGDKKAQKRAPLKKVMLKRMKAASELPEDLALPGLVAIRAACQAGAFPSQGTGGHPVELRMRGYTAGSRATLEARVGNRRVAFKAYAENPSSEAALYEALAAAGLGGDSGVRVPPLLAWQRDLRVLVIGWLEGPTVEELVEDQQGERAGELGARWFQRMASVSVKIGPPVGAAHILGKTAKWAEALAKADRALGSEATALAGKLEHRLPKECVPRLVHGTLYARHILDLGDAPGVIDWQKFGQGPLELDAGIFLTTIWRIGLRKPSWSGEAARAEKAFRSGTKGLLDERAIGWHRAAMLLRLANKLTRRQDKADWSARAHFLLSEAARLVKTS